MDFLREHKEPIIFGLIVLIILIIIYYYYFYQPATTSEYMKVPWKNRSEYMKTPWKKRSEHMKVPWKHKNENMVLFSGDLTPSEQAMYNRLSTADPISSKNKTRSEYFSNKGEVPSLTKMLYSP